MHCSGLYSFTMAWFGTAGNIQGAPHTAPWQSLPASRVTGRRACLIYRSSVVVVAPLVVLNPSFHIRQPRRLVNLPDCVLLLWIVPKCAEVAQAGKMTSGHSRRRLRHQKKFKFHIVVCLLFLERKELFIGRFRVDFFIFCEGFLERRGFANSALRNAVLFGKLLGFYGTDEDSLRHLERGTVYALWRVFG